MIKVAILTTDSREHFKDYNNPQPYFGTAPAALLEGFKLIPNEVEVHVLSCLQRIPVESPTKLADNLYYYPLHVPNIGWLKTGYLGCVKAVRRKLREIEPDIVHGQGTERDCAMCAAHSGYAAVITLHGVMASLCAKFTGQARLYYAFAHLLENHAIRNVAGVVCISSVVRRVVTPLAKQTWLVPNAVRSEFLKQNVFRPRSTVSIPSLINVGLVSPLKRQKELLELLLPLRARFPFRLTFVGGLDAGSRYGREFTDLLRKAQAQYEDFQHIHSLDAHSLRQSFDSADALVHFSKEESFCLVLAEARARQMSVFTTAVGAAMEICGAPNAKSCVVPVNGGSKLQEVLTSWLRQRAFLDFREDAPAHDIAARMAPRIVAEQHLEIYREVGNGLRRQPW